MLRRMLKYDLKRTLKFLLIFMLLALFFGVATRLIGTLSDSLAVKVIEGICNGTAISMMFSLFINCLMRSWVMFRSALYGDESYLTHTLPVKKETHYASKALAAAICVFVSMVAIIAVLFIMYWTENVAQLVKQFIEPFADYLGASVWEIALCLFVILFLEFFNVTQLGFMGIILGHRYNQSKILLSVVFGFIAYMITQIVTVFGMLLVGLLNTDIMEIFKTSDVAQMKPEVIISTALIGISFYALFCVIGFIMNTKFLKKGVNVD